MRIDQLIKIRREIFDNKKSNEPSMDPNPCWEGYEPYGTKELDGKTVPNCVPKKEEQRTVKEGFPIPSPEGNEEQDKFISRCIAAIIDEYGQEQASAICYDKWDKK
jgi:hypothetical protein